MSELIWEILAAAALLAMFIGGPLAILGLEDERVSVERAEPQTPDVRARQAGL